MDERKLVCDCNHPIPEHIPLFDTYMCKRCWRKLVTPKEYKKP